MRGLQDAVGDRYMSEASEAACAHDLAMHEVMPADHHRSGPCASHVRSYLGQVRDLPPRRPSSRPSPGAYLRPPVRHTAARVDCHGWPATSSDGQRSVRQLIAISSGGWLPLEATRLAPVPSHFICIVAFLDRPFDRRIVVCSRPQPHRQPHPSPIPSSSSFFFLLSPLSSPSTLSYIHPAQHAGPRLQTSHCGRQADPAAPARPLAQGLSQRGVFPLVSCPHVL